MQFRLPDNLQTELLAYDPSLKALAKQQKPAAPATKKTTHPLGNPHDLIPVDIVSKDTLATAIERINRMAAKFRYYAFNRFEMIDYQRTNIVYAIIYYYEQCWYAAWLPPADQRDKYVYGYRYAFKNTEAARKAMAHAVKSKIDQHQEVKYGRSTFYTYGETVTLEQIKTMPSSELQYGWNLAGVPTYYQKSGEMRRNCINAFSNSLSLFIPTWQDSREIFERIRNQHCIASLLISYSDVSSSYWNTVDKNSWVPSHESLLNLIDYNVIHEGLGYSRGYEYKRLDKIKHIINTPFFKKWIEEQCALVMTRINDSSITDSKLVAAPWKTIIALLTAIYGIHSVWDDCPIDYYQSHMSALIAGGNCFSYASNLVQKWLKDNMPVASFFKIVEKSYAKELAGNMYFDREIQHYTYRLHEWRDTMNMLTNILNKQDTFDPPSRWRIEEFHDHVQSTAWKLNNENQSLPQDLFPTPIKIMLGESTWTFFQPIDTHQLAAWGQAVRNCVGSASGYAEGVRKKKHFIVLCMIDNKPVFTIQLDVNNGVMNVNQIKGVSNTSLKPEQQELYTTAFSQALKARDAELASKS
jgi:hypothetical protein